MAITLPNPISDKNVLKQGHEAALESALEPWMLFSYAILVSIIAIRLIAKNIPKKANKQLIYSSAASEFLEKIEQ